MTDFSDLAKQSEKLRHAINAQDGVSWKESYMENHFQYNEIPIWILAYSDVEIEETHAKFVSILQDHIAGLKYISISLCYQTILDGDFIQIDYLGNTEEVLRGYSIGPLGENEEKIEKDLVVFKSHDAKRGVM